MPVEYLKTKTEFKHQVELSLNAHGSLQPRMICHDNFPPQHSFLVFVKS